MTLNHAKKSVNNLACSKTYINEPISFSSYFWLFKNIFFGLIFNGSSNLGSTTCQNLNNVGSFKADITNVSNVVPALSCHICVKIFNAKRTFHEHLLKVHLRPPDRYNTVKFYQIKKSL